jgi:ABC-type transporter Mla MlaB component
MLCALFCHALGTAVALLPASAEGTTQVLRISVASDSSQAIRFQLEGNLAGPWVEELRRLADDALSQKKSVSLDLRGVRFVDMQGVLLLREFSRRQVSHVNCSQFVIQQMKEVEQ